MIAIQTKFYMKVLLLNIEEYRLLQFQVAF